MQQGNKDRAGTVTKRLIYPRFRLIQWACGLALTRAENGNELQCCFWKMTAWRATTKFWFFLQMHQGNILRRWRGVSRFTYIFSISSNCRLEPSGMLTNFQPPPFPRLPRGPSFSTVNFQPSLGRRLLYLWHCTLPAICGKKTTSLIWYNRGTKYAFIRNWTVDQLHIEPRKDKEDNSPMHSQQLKNFNSNF